MGKAKIQKYVIYRNDQGIWWGRVPWGVSQPFPTWEQAAGYLTLKHRLITNDKPYRPGRSG